MDQSRFSKGYLRRAIEILTSLAAALSLVPSAYKIEDPAVGTGTRQG